MTVRSVSHNMSVTSLRVVQVMTRSRERPGILSDLTAPTGVLYPSDRANLTERSWISNLLLGRGIQQGAVSRV